MRDINRIIIHCSATNEPHQMDVDSVRELHVSERDRFFKWGEYPTFGKGFSNIGYHYLVKRNGSVEFGRHVERPGAHAKGFNSDSIGICLHGLDGFPEEQFLGLKKLLDLLLLAYGLKKTDIVGHNSVNPHKSCPNFVVNDFVKKYF